MWPILPFNDDFARHHVLCNARTHRTVDRDVAAIVHPGAVVADRALDLDRQRRSYSDGHGVMSARIEDIEVSIVTTLFYAVQNAF